MYKLQLSGCLERKYLGRGKMLFTLLTLSLIACSGQNSEETNTPPNRTYIDSTNIDSSNINSEPKQMEDLVVDESFDWKVTKMISLNLTLLNEIGEPFSGHSIEIYGHVSNATQGLPMGASLLFSGWANQQGKLNLQHQVKKGDTKLILKVMRDQDNTFVDIPLFGAGYDDQTSIVSVTLFL